MDRAVDFSQPERFGRVIAVEAVGQPVVNAIEESPPDGRLCA
jgi:hypothetical protein